MIIVAKWPKTDNLYESDTYTKSCGNGALHTREIHLNPRFDDRRNERYAHEYGTKVVFLRLINNPDNAEATLARRLKLGSKGAQGNDSRNIKLPGY